MIHYTDQIARLMGDIVMRVPALRFIDLNRLIVFGRTGRSSKGGPLATCHAVNQPPSAPTHYRWCDRRGRVLRRSEWFVVKSPSVSIRGTPIDYLISVALPRFCDQTLERSPKREFYAPRAATPQVAKLDTIVHELYHIAPDWSGIRGLDGATGDRPGRAHSPAFYRQVAAMVEQYLATGPAPELMDFLRHGARELVRRYGEVAATTFDSFPSFPQPYLVPLAQQPLPVEDGPGVQIVRLTAARQRREYSERHLHTRHFLPRTIQRGAVMTRRAPRYRELQ